MARLVIVTVFIEKREGQYTAYSPNLPGVEATAVTREEIERQILDAVELSIGGASERYLSATDRVDVSPKPLPEKIQCAALLWFAGPKGGEQDRCHHQAHKDGLCSQHWREAYGHATSRYHRDKCELCGEDDPEKLEWCVPCPDKASDPHWSDRLYEQRARENAERARRRKVRKLLGRARPYNGRW